MKKLVAVIAIAIALPACCALFSAKQKASTLPTSSFREFGPLTSYEPGTLIDASSDSGVKQLIPRQWFLDTASKNDLKENMKLLEPRRVPAMQYVRDKGAALSIAANLRLAELEAAIDKSSSVHVSVQEMSIQELRDVSAIFLAVLDSYDEAKDLGAIRDLYLLSKGAQEPMLITEVLRYSEAEVTVTWNNNYSASAETQLREELLAAENMGSASISFPDASKLVLTYSDPDNEDAIPVGFKGIPVNPEDIKKRFPTALADL